MSLTVGGYELPQKYLGTKIDVTFYDLTDEGKKEMFLKHKDAFFALAIMSENENIQKFAIEHCHECSSKTLNDTIWLFTRAYYSLKYAPYILEILNSPNLCLEYDLRKELSMSDDVRVRRWVIEDPNTSEEILRDMARRQLTQIVKITSR